MAKACIKNTLDCIFICCQASSDLELMNQSRSIQAHTCLAAWESSPHTEGCGSYKRITNFWKLKCNDDRVEGEEEVKLHSLIYAAMRKLKYTTRWWRWLSWPEEAKTKRHPICPWHGDGQGESKQLTNKFLAKEIDDEKCFNFHYVFAPRGIANYSSCITKRSSHHLWVHISAGPSIMAIVALILSLTNSIGIVSPTLLLTTSKLMLQPPWLPRLTFLTRLAMHEEIHAVKKNDTKVGYTFTRLEIDVQLGLR